jgi:hypothetical protein
MKIMILLGCDTVQSSKSMHTVPRTPLHSTPGQKMGDMTCNTMKFKMMTESYRTIYMSNFRAL